MDKVSEEGKELYTPVVGHILCGRKIWEKLQR